MSSTVSPKAVAMGDRRAVPLAALVDAEVDALHVGCPDQLRCRYVVYRAALIRCSPVMACRVGVGVGVVGQGADMLKQIAAKISS